MAKRKAKKAKTAKARVDRWIEQHGATEPFTIFDHGKVQATAARRRVADAALQRFLDRLGPQHSRAAEDVEAGFRSLARTLGSKHGLYGERFGGNHDYRALAVSIMAERFIRWGQACTKAQPMIDYAAVRSILIDGVTFSTIDAQLRRRNGWASKQLERGLDLWIDMRNEERRAARYDKIERVTEFG